MMFDPICGMSVDPKKPRASAQHDGQTFYFCNPRCAEKFLAAPADYLTAKDPVCGMTPKRATAKAARRHDKKPYFFCSTRCAEKFDADPAAFVDGGSGKAAPSANHEKAAVAPGGEHQHAGGYVCPMCPEVHETEAVPCPSCGMALEAADPLAALQTTEWICPMHPEVVQAQPGDCPKCGMALEARTVALEQAESPELADMRRRFRVSLVFTLPVFLLAMSEMLPGDPVGHALSGVRIGPLSVAGLLELLLATPVVAYCGYPFFQRAIQSLRSWNLNMFTLIGLGTFVAYSYSVVAVLAPSLFPAELLTRRGEGGRDFEAAAGIICLVLLGQVLELKARGATSGAIRALLGLTPKTARRVDRDGRESDVPLAQVQVGDRLRIRPGESVPADGEVLEGQSAIDESMISGEPMPVQKSTGDGVTGGTINGTGALLMRADRVGADTLLSQIVRLVSEAQRSRAPIQRVADTVSGYFVPAVVLCALIAFAAWMWLGPEPRLTYAIVAAVSVLIIACPCALGLATPMSVMVGTGRGAQLGILFKNAEALERLEQVNTVVVDKTGTLTEGKPTLVDVATAPGHDGHDVLRLAASLENASEHPLASAISAGARSRGLALDQPTDFESVTGKGVRGSVDSHTVVVGNASMLELDGIDVSTLTERAEAARAEGSIAMFVAIDGTAAAVLVVADPIKASTAEAIAGLRHAGIEVVMLTGDSRRTAEAVAKQIGIERVEAEVLPQDKSAVVAALQRDGKVVLMAGDGVNDAPALARADVGVAMGTGTDIAMQSAGVALVRGDLRGLLRARQLSHRTMANIRQNLLFAFLYNALGVPIAAGALYPVFGMLLSPMIAAAAMSLSSVSVISNALRLRRVAL